MQEKRFEDTLSVEDLLKKPTKEIQIMTYIQTVKTNDRVAKNIKDIENLKKEVRNKIGWKIFTIGASVLTLVILAFGLLNVLGGG